MAISFVLGTSGNNNNGGDVTLNITGAQEDDIVIVAVTCADDDNVNETMAMTTSGYTVEIETYADDTVDCNFGVFWKVMGSTPDTQAVATGLGGNDVGVSACALVFRGVDTTTPFDVTSTVDANVNTQIAAPPSINFNDSGAWVVIAGGCAHTNGPSQTATAPTGYTTNAQNSTGNDTSDSTTALAYNSSPSDPETPGAFSYSGSDSTSFSWGAGTMALRPASGGGLGIPIAAYHFNHNTGSNL